MTLTTKAFRKSSLAITSSYQAVVKPIGGKIARLAVEKDSATTTTSGASTKTRTAAASR